IDIDPYMIGLRYPFEVNLVGDAKETLTALLPQLKRSKKRKSWRKKIEKDNGHWWKVMQRRAKVTADPINPEYVVHALDSLLPEDVILTSDSGSAANWYARHLRIRGNMRGSLSGTLATMGPGVPYAIGAKFAHPDRPVIALVGDGAMQMNGMAELITMLKYWEAWEDPRLIVAVLNNQDLNQVTWEMRAMNGAPQFLPSQSLPDIPYADFAKLIGLDGVRVEKAGDDKSSWHRALGADRPFVLDFRTDPDVPPIPPHASLVQIESLTSAILHGDSASLGILREGTRGKLQEFLPARASWRKSGRASSWTGSEGSMSLTEQGGPEPIVEEIGTAVYTVPCDETEADGTLTWHSTTLVLVHVRSEGVVGLGYTYGAPATAQVIEDQLADVVVGRSVWGTAAVNDAMNRVVRNAGRPGLVSGALSAVDIALWDLKS